MTDLQVTFKAGGSFVHIPPKFSLSSENIYVASNDYVSSYNTKTGKLCTTYKGLTGPIVDFHVHEYQSHECITGCSDLGEIITWKTVTHFKIFNKKIYGIKPLTFNVVANGDDLKALYSYKFEFCYRFAVLNLITANLDVVCDLKLSLHSPMHVSSNNNFFAVAQQHKIRLVKFSDLSSVVSMGLAKTRLITCIKCHNTEEEFLLGDSSGRILFYQDIFRKKVTHSVFHWHTLPVKCVAFSPEGSHFYSGGEECVMVRWQPDNISEKRFLPRLPSYIKHIEISPSNFYIAIATVDNAITIVDAKYDRISMIQNLVIGDQIRSGIFCCPRSKALLMNGNVGQIQFYLPQENSLLYTVDVVGQNRITNERSCKIENTQVTKIAQSICGTWMATIEERPDLEFTSEIRLKFWLFESTTQNFVLNTNIEYPHDESVNSLAFQPAGLNRMKCVSVGDDKKFKVWHLVDASTIYKKGNAWHLLYAGFYREFPCKNVTFTTDSSLMAIGFDEIITAWVPETCELKTSLIHPVYKQKIEHLRFGKGHHCHLLVAAGDKYVITWDILTLAAFWVVPMQVSLLIDDPITLHMAVITASSKMYMFMPNSPDLVYSSGYLVPKEKKIDAAVFVPTKYSNDNRLSWHERSQIYFIDNHQVLYNIGVDEDTESPVIPVNNGLSSTFSMTIPKSKVNFTESNHESGQSQLLLPKESPYMTKFLDSTTQTMPPVRDVCLSMLKEMVFQIKV